MYKDKFPEIPFNIGLNVKYYQAGSEELACNTFKNIQNNDIVALEKHGIVCISNNLNYAIDFYAFIEISAQKRRFPNKQ